MPVLLAIAVVGVLIFVHELGHFLAARTQNIHVTRFAIGFGPVLWKFEGAETEYSLRAIPLGGYVAFPDDELDSAIAPDDPGLLKNRPILDRAIVISAGVIANLVFAFLLLFVQVGWVGVPNLQAAPGVIIPQVVSGVSSVAAQAGIKDGDLVTAIDGEPLGSGDEAVQALMMAIKEHPSEAIRLNVERAGETQTITLTPRLGEDGTPRIGVRLAPNGTLVRKPAGSIGELVAAADQEFQRVVLLTLQGFAQLVVNFQETASQVSGPVAIVAMGADIARNDVSRLLQFGALISVNLAIINILPLPALDGGQLAFLLIEGISGRPLPTAVQQGVMQTGLVLLLGLGMFFIIRDVSNLEWIQRLMS